MLRLVMLFVLLAHLGVASIPCVDAASMVATAAAQRVAMSAGTAHPLAESEVEAGAHEVGHMTSPHPAEHAHAEHGPASPHAASHAASHAAPDTTSNAPSHASDAAGAHESHDAAHDTHRGHAKPQAQVVQLELRAPCLCGCSERSNTPGTTTPQPPSFAPSTLDAPCFVAAIPSVAEAAPGPWPVPPPDVVDHIPITS